MAYAANNLHNTARPWYGRFQICVVWDDGVASPDPASESERIAAIDFGVDHLAAMANNIGMPGLLFKGGIVKSENQWFNKEKARITSELTKGKEKKSCPRTHRLDSFSRHREGVMRTQMNTCARRLVERCAEWDVDTLVLGVNRGWKQNSDMGTASNQKFVSVPHDRLRMCIHQLAEARGGAGGKLYIESFVSARRRDARIWRNGQRMRNFQRLERNTRHVQAERRKKARQH